MIKLALSAAVTVALSTGALASSIAPSIGALVPSGRARAGVPSRSPRFEHCSRKADGVRVQGPARDIYMRRCVKG